MYKCAECGTEFEVGETICAQCGHELPAPYELGEEAPTPMSSEELAQAANDLMRQLGMPMSGLTILSGATLVLEDGMIEPGTLFLGGGRIVGALEGAVADPQNGARFCALEGYTIAPGFIDVHTHGMMGIDTNRATVEEFKRWSLEVAKRGVTSLLPTTVACTADELDQLARRFRQAREEGLPGARMLGLHLESNFLNMDFKGAQPPGVIFPSTDPRAGAVISVIEEHADLIVKCTIAPEIDGGLDLIGWLREQEIIASLGHSGANYEQAMAGIEAGALHATHLFNAMPPLHHRNPGLVGAVLEHDEIYAEMVCDGMHIHPSVITTTITAKGAERFLPITDSLEGTGLPDGSVFILGGQRVTIVDGIGRLDNNTIAGSVATMDQVLRRLVGEIGWDLGEALFMMATSPANSLGLRAYGRIVHGAVADLVVLDGNLQVAMTIVAGNIVYQA